MASSHRSSDRGQDARVAAGAARAVRCVLLVRESSHPPESLLRSFRARGVEVSLETEPVLALAALGAAIVEHRQRIARQSTFHATGDSSTPHPSLILVVIEPAEWDDLDELAACIERTMPQVTVAVYSEQSGSGLEVLRRGRVAQPSAPPPGQDEEPDRRARAARPALHLAQTPSPAPRRTEADTNLSLDAADADDPDEESESLITQAELAMLLGDDIGEDSARGGQAP